MQPQDPNNTQPPQPDQFPQNQPYPQQPQPQQPNYGAYPSNPENLPPQTPPPAMPAQPQPQGQPVPQANGAPAPEPQQMYYTRPLEPLKPTISPEIQEKSEESLRKYPGLNLSEGEYVISDVKRHPIGLLGVWAVCGLALLAVIVVVGMLAAGSRDATSGAGIPPSILGIGAALLCVLILIGGYIATYIYTANKFYLTNESVIQNIQMSLFSNRQQTVSLGNVEDASYLKSGIIQTILDYGTIRLSTQGDETTYRFTFAADPDRKVAKLNNAVEAFKNGRPVLDDDDPAPREHHSRH